MKKMFHAFHSHLEGPNYSCKLSKGYDSRYGLDDFVLSSAPLFDSDHTVSVSL